MANTISYLPNSNKTITENQPETEARKMGLVLTKDANGQNVTVSTTENPYVFLDANGNQLSSHPQLELKYDSDAGGWCVFTKTGAVFDYENNPQVTLAL